MRTNLTHVFRLPLVAAVVLLSAACNNPVEPEDHPEAGGVLIRDAGTGAVLALSVGANVAFAEPLELTASDVLEVEILFLDASDPDDLALAFHPDEDEGESLNVEITNEAIVTYADHGDHGDFTAHAAGQTTVTIELMHGGHADFRSGFLTIMVQ
jgi:hypothetical protein